MSGELERKMILFFDQIFRLGSEKVWTSTLESRRHFRLSGAEQVTFRGAKHSAHQLLLAQFLRAWVRLTSSKQVPGAARISFWYNVRVRFSGSEEVTAASVSGCRLGVFGLAGSQKVAVISGPFLQVWIFSRVFKTSPRSNQDKNKWKNLFRGFLAVINLSLFSNSSKIN